MLLSTMRNLLIGGATALIVAAAGAASEAEKAGHVANLVGAATATPDGGAARELANADPIHLLERVRTEAETRATLALGDTTLNLGEVTEVTIESYVVEAGGVLNLGTGAMLFTYDGPPADFEVRSQYGRIVVRGTTFFAGPSRGVFGVFVQEGAVSVTAAGETVLLEDGEGTNIPAPGEAPSEPVMWGEPRVEEALASVL